jgi:hypothetical protein
MSATCLGDVERRAAAEADHAIGVVLAERGDTALDLRARGIAEDAAVDVDREAREPGAETREDRKRREAPCRSR